MRVHPEPVSLERRPIERLAGRDQARSLGLASGPEFIVLHRACYA